MPGSTLKFAYRLQPTDPGDLERTLQKARKILGWACDGDKRVTCHGISGEGLGFVQLNLTVRHRDQWACQQLAQDILNYVTWGIAQKVDLDLQSERLPPHENRGYERGNRTKRWRERPAPEATASEADS